MARDFRALAVRANWLKEAICPKCGESNTKLATNVIEVDEQGNAYCNNCSETWKAEDE